MYQSTEPRLTYESAKALVYATASVPDGYFGKRTRVGIAYDPSSQKTIAVHSIGYFNLNLDAIDVSESEWLCRNHPAMRDYLIGFKMITA